MDLLSIFTLIFCSMIVGACSSLILVSYLARRNTRIEEKMWREAINQAQAFNKTKRGIK